MYEISQKQHFIFRTNRLKENIGASHIIRELTTNPRKLFEQSLFQKEVEKPLSLPDPQYRIVGGGNATFIFDNEHDATIFSRHLSINILRYFPGIELFLVNRTIQWNEELLFRKGDQEGVLNKLRNELANKKNERRYAVKQESWGIQKACVSSGLPANIEIKNEDEEYQPRAAEFKLIQKIGERTRDDEYSIRFIKENEFLPTDPDYRFLEQNDLEKVFGKESSVSNVKSYLAIIALDGNAMGIKVGKFFEQPFKCNEDFIEKYKKFTDDIDNAYTQAFRKTIHYVMEKYDVWAPDFYNEEELDKWKKVIPIRPIIASGDDVSFITYGKLGIEVAKTFLQYLQEQTMKIGEGENERTYQFEACAGVAIIRHRYPFWLGIRLAENLSENAKKRLKNEEEKWLERGMTSNHGLPYDTSLIDWHLVTHADMVEDIESYRIQFYQNKDGSILSMRPYYVQRETDPKTHFASYEDTFKRLAIKALQRTENNDKKIRKDHKIPSMAKWKNLREVYHEGKQAVNQWQILNQFSPTGESHTDYLFLHYENGFGLLDDPHNENGQAFATYYDAIEIFDFFTDLSGRIEE